MLQAQERREAAASRVGRWWRTHLQCREARLALEVHRRLEAAKMPGKQREQAAAGQIICDFMLDASKTGPGRCTELPYPVFALLCSWKLDSLLQLLY